MTLRYRSRSPPVLHCIHSAIRPQPDECHTYAHSGVHTDLVRSRGPPVAAPHNKSDEEILAEYEQRLSEKYAEEGVPLDDDIKKIIH